MRTLYLHIGLPKTGSTFLQKQIFPRLTDLRVNAMPDNTYFRDQGTRLLESIFSRSETIWQSHSEPLLDLLLGSDWRSADCDFLVSDEAIGRTTSRQSLCAAHLAQMRAALEQAGIGRLKLLCFTRRQDHWLASHYVQMSDRRDDPGQKDFEQFIGRITDPLGGRYTFGALLDYAATYAALGDALGRENIHFLPMEWMSADPEALRRALADWLDLPADRIDLSRSKNENVRRTREGEWKLRREARLQRMRDAITRRPSTIQLDGPFSDRIRGVYQDSNLRLMDAIGLDLGKLGYFG